MVRPMITFFDLEIVWGFFS